MANQANGRVWSFSHLCSYLLQVWLISWYSLRKTAMIIVWLMCFCRSLSVGTKTGYRLFSVTAVDKLDCIHEGGIKEPFTNTHLTIIHIHGWLSLPEAVVRFTLCVHACSQQTVLSLLHSSASKVTFEVGLNQENLNVKRNTRHQRRSSCFHFHEQSLQLNIPLLFQVNSTGKSLTCVPSGESWCVYSGAAVLQQSGGGGQSVHAAANERLSL